MDKYAIQALEEYNSDTKTVRRGGIDGKPFWNGYSSRFMYAPSLFFTPLLGAKEYIFTATDSKGKVHTFKADSSTAPLTPIWKDIEPGIVELKKVLAHICCSQA